MALPKIVKVQGRGVYVPGDDIDTDRIIPARFMKCVTFDGLGAYAFYDARFDEQGNSKGHPLDDPRFRGATILLSNSNFGCGSSREHAPQALSKFGIRAIIAESFAEIFFGNATTLGMPCVSVTRDAVSELARAIEADPATEVTLDLEAKTVRAGTLSFPFDMKPGARDALIRGEWDPIGQLLDAANDVRAVAQQLPYLSF
ncbi:MAG: 3-isopropylmalate dehydratase small subunit [Pseudomonadota bacterium]|nr:MAG: 3-isopropylmalate dehydratase small subunit [Pseudomonadota bacterium]